MDKNKLYFYISLILTLSVIVLLVTGSSLLNKDLDNDKSIPLGTLITWTGMISLPLLVYWGVMELRKPSNKLNGILSRFIKTIIVMGFLWVPISFLLAGNLSFSFSDKGAFQGGQLAMRLFWYLSFGIPIGTILTLLIYWGSLLIKKLQ